MSDEDGVNGDDGGGADEEGVNTAALFQHQALATNEIFGLAGRMYCRIIDAWVRNGNDLPRALAPFSALHAEPWSRLFALQQRGLAVRRLFLSGDAASAEAEVEAGLREEGGVGGGAGSGPRASASDAVGDSLSELQDQVREWLRDSLTILKSLILERLPAFVSAVEGAALSKQASAAGGSGAPPRSPSRTSLREDEIEMLFSIDSYERLVGAFELNNIEMKIDSPVRDYIASIASLPPAARTSALAALSPVVRQIVAAHEARRELTSKVNELLGDEDEGEDEEEDDDGEDEEDGDEEDSDGGAAAGAGVCLLVLPADEHGPELPVPSRAFPVCDGTALFALTCCANHSCAPIVQASTQPTHPPTHPPTFYNP
jgi:hypothetical protein